MVCVCLLLVLASQLGCAGDLLYIEILGQKILVINSEKVAEDLLDKRSQNYSDRPQVPMVKLYAMVVASELGTDDIGFLD